MTKREISDRIIQIAFDATGAELSENETLKESGLDSLSLVTVIAELEERFGFAFTESELNPEELQTLTDLVRITENHL